MCDLYRILSFGNCTHTGYFCGMKSGSSASGVHSIIRNSCLWAQSAIFMLVTSAALPRQPAPVAVSASCTSPTFILNLEDQPGSKPSRRFQRKRISPKNPRRKRFSPSPSSSPEKRVVIRIAPQYAQGGWR